MSLSPQWKGLQKYITTAKQVEKVDGVVSYYLRMFAIQEAMRLIKQRSAEDNKQLSALMDQVESSRSLTKNVSLEDAKLKVETYALNVFDHGDNEDRAGKTTKEVAKAFLTSAIIMECTKQFGELSSDIEQKLKYARWRSSEVNKAVKEGRAAAPPSDAGGPMDEENLPAAGSAMQPSSSSAASSFPASNGTPSVPSLPAPSDLGNSSFGTTPPVFGVPSPSSNLPSSGYTAPSYSQPLAPPPASNSLLPPPGSSSFSLPSATSPPPASYPSPATATHSASPLAVGSNLKPVAIPDQPTYRYAPGQPILVYPVDTTEQKLTKLQSIKEGERYTKHALSALSFDDINTAVAKLQAALSVLAPYQTEKKR